MSRQMFARGGPAVPMQEGGMAVPSAPMPEPSALGPQMAPPGLPVDPNSVDINEAAQAAMQNGLDPAMLEGMLTNYSQGLEDLENAEDYETVINGIRGDSLPIEQRYNELAEVVGPEDARATPESVLTLIQPVMQMAAVDQGIGGLAAEEMTGPVEGPMAEGIMSTVNMGGVDQAQGGPAPVNFNQGGAVQHFAPENQQRVVGAPLDLNRQKNLFEQQRALYGSLIDPADRESDFKEQQDLTKAQMLFDVAQGALGFAAGAGRPGATPAEQLASAFTPVVGNIGARAGELAKFKQAQKTEDRQLDLAALQSSQELYGKERAAEIAREDKPITDVFRVTIRGNNGVVSATNRPLTNASYRALTDEHGEENVDVSEIFAPTTAAKPANFLVNGQVVSAIPGTARYRQLLALGAPVAGNVPTSAITDRKQFTVTAEITIGDKTYPTGSSPFLSPIEQQAVAASFGNDVLTAYQPPTTDADYFSKFGMTKAEFEKLSKENRQFLQGLPVLTENDYFNKFGMPKNDFLGLPKATQQRLVGIAPEYVIKEFDDGTSKSLLAFDKNDPNAEPINLYSADIVGTADYFQVTMPSANDSEIVLKSIIDVSTADGRAAVEAVNAQNKLEPGSAAMQRVPTASTRMSSFFVPSNVEEGVPQVVMSYDGGRTYTGIDGLPRQLPPDAFELSDTTSYNIYARSKQRQQARSWLIENDNALVNNQYFGTAPKDVEGIGNPDVIAAINSGALEDIKAKDKELVRDTLKLVRDGTGVWSSVGAFVNAVVGGTVAPETISEVFAKTEEGRQFVQLVYVLGRSALASSPRLAVADLQVTGSLFPNPEAIFRNPVTEANKLRSLMVELNREERRLYELSASPANVSKAQLDIAEQKIGEIARLKNLLGPIQAMGGTDGGVKPGELSDATQALRNKVNRNRGTQ